MSGCIVSVHQSARSVRQGRRNDQRCEDRDEILLGVGCWYPIEASVMPANTVTMPPAVCAGPSLRAANPIPDGVRVHPLEPTAYALIPFEAAHKAVLPYHYRHNSKDPEITGAATCMPHRYCCALTNIFSCGTFDFPYCEIPLWRYKETKYTAIQ